jgi:hypothetical protein
MLFFGKPPGDIDAADIRRLVDEAQPESRTLEYKEAAYSRDKRDDFLADVSAFANSAGGFLIIGVKCEQGVPVDAPGIPAEAVDGIWLQMLNWLRDCLDPRLDGMLRQDIDLGNGRRVLVVGVPKSWNQPHMVRANGRFYVRTNAGNEPCDCGQVRSLILQGNEAGRRILEWRAERVARLLSDQGPEVLAVRGEPFSKSVQRGTPAVCLHIASVGDSSDGGAADLASATSARLEPMVWTGSSSRYCFEGLLWDSTESSSDGTRCRAGYSILFRDGRIETASAQVIRPNNPTVAGFRLLYGQRLERSVIEFLRRAMVHVRTAGATTPLVILLSVLRVREYAVVASQYDLPGFLTSLGRDAVLVPEVVVRDLAEDPGRFMRPAFDTLWNSSGWPGSPHYDETGNWVDRP